MGGIINNIVNTPQDVKQQVYSNKEAIMLLDKRLEMMEREHQLFQKEIKTDIMQSQKNTVYEIKELLATEYKENQKWKDRALIGLISSGVLLVLSELIKGI